jgi:hypothetical protein
MGLRDRDYMRGGRRADPGEDPVEGSSWTHRPALLVLGVVLALLALLGLILSAL